MKKHKGFTVVELLIVMAAIGIIVALFSVGVTQAPRRAAESVMRSDLTQSAAGFKLSRVSTSGTWTQLPAAFVHSPTATYGLKEATATSFCIDGTSKRFDDMQFHIDQTEVVQSGLCPGGAPVAPGGDPYESLPMTLSGLGSPSISCGTSPTRYINVDWFQLSGATHYDLRRDYNVSGEWELLLDVESVYHTPTPQSGVYKYQLRARNASGRSDWTSTSQCSVSAIKPMSVSGTIA